MLDVFFKRVVRGDAAFVEVCARLFDRRVFLMASGCYSCYDYWKGRDRKRIVGRWG